MQVSPERVGARASFFAKVAVAEAIARACFPCAFALINMQGAVTRIEREGTAEQKSGAGHVRVFRVDETNAKSVSSQPARAGPTNELLWLRSFHVASAFPSGGFASPEGGAFTTPVV